MEVKPLILGFLGGLGATAIILSIIAQPNKGAPTVTTTREVKLIDDLGVLGPTHATDKPPALSD